MNRLPSEVVEFICEKAFNRRDDGQLSMMLFFKLRVTLSLVDTHQYSIMNVMYTDIKLEGLFTEYIVLLSKLYDSREAMGALVDAVFINTRYYDVLKRIMMTSMSNEYTMWKKALSTISSSTLLSSLMGFTTHDSHITNEFVDLSVDVDLTFAYIRRLKYNYNYQVTVREPIKGIGDRFDDLYVLVSDDNVTKPVVVSVKSKSSTDKISFIVIDFARLWPLNLYLRFARHLQSEGGLTMFLVEDYPKELAERLNLIRFRDKEDCLDKIRENAMHIAKSESIFVHYTKTKDHYIRRIEEKKKEEEEAVRQRIRAETMRLTQESHNRVFDRVRKLAQTLSECREAERK